MQFLVKLVWKVYFFFLLFVFIKLTWGQVGFRLEDGIDTAMMIASLVAFFCFAFEKSFLKPAIWKLFFVTLLMWDFYYHFVIQSVALQGWPTAGVLFFLLMLLPLYLGIYCYAFITAPQEAK